MKMKMKLMILVFLACMMFVGNALAAGSVTVSIAKMPSDTIRVVTFSWTADASDGSVPSTTVSAAITQQIAGWNCFLGVTNPGSTAPTDNYDIVVNDTDGVDIFGGKLNNRDTATSEQAVPLVGGAYMTRPVTGAITMVLTNNSVNSATGTLQLFFSKN